MNIFYEPSAGKSDIVTLDPTESGHCIRVMRHRTGDQVEIVDGAGGRYTGQIISEDPAACDIRVIGHERQITQPDRKVHIGIAPTKRIDRFEWFLEKATEIGITSITPIICSRSERTRVRADRMHKILVSAMKQSGRAFLPQLNEPLKFEQVINGTAPGSKFIAHCVDDDKTDLLDVAFSDEITFLIGPEGDFTEEEIRKALQNGYLAVSMGQSTLRTETAGIMAVAAAFFKPHT